MRYDTLENYIHDFYEKQKKYLRLNKTQTSFSMFGKAVGSWNSLRDYVPSAMDLQFPLTKIAFAQLHDYVVDKLISEKKQPKDLDADLKNTKIGIDILTGLKYVIEDGGLMPYDFKTFKESIDEEDYEVLYANREYIKAAFHPSKGLSWIDCVATPTGPKEHTHYNSFIPPIYRHYGAPTKFPLCETYVRPFFELFLPKKDERDYVIHWLQRLQYERNQDVLVFIGVQGNGKNTFMQLATVIAGKENTIIGSKNFGKDKFNGEVMKRKLVNLDEFSIKGAAKESIKCFSNDDITVEVKGSDPIQIQNHCSFIVANNSMRSTDFEFKDRRFTCPTLNQKDLLLEWPKEKISKFKAAIKTLEFNLELPAWLDKYVEENKLIYPNRMNYITPHFYNLVEAAKPEWFKEFKRQLAYKESVNTQDIYKATRTKVSDSKLQEHIAKEIEERSLRDIKPHVICTHVTEEGKTNYLSNLYTEEEQRDDDSIDDETKV